MAKATIRTDDSAALSDNNAAVAHDTVTDTKGRRITLRRLSVLQEMRLLKILGEYNSSYYAFCAQIARVASIDGDAVAVPNSEREIEATAQRLGKEGVAALMSVVTAAPDDDAEKAAVQK